jgi:hypothetical protein
VAFVNPFAADEDEEEEEAIDAMVGYIDKHSSGFTDTAAKA